ncbi:MAG TPA: lipoyl(octanoyl) transferase LipB [Candidatus Angelobacter sp.]|jgi:lipoyl(octanoyl) transferase|nr:lipoyl(octanoyl) transferase LipB [Candidatus Angelobacter sp.]
MLTVINVLYLGRVDYSIALELQQTLVRLVKEGRITHTLLLLEHPPVITLGRNAGAQNIVASREFLTANGVELHETDRGGDVTFHGPGQLVGYPIFDLRAFEPRIGAVDFVRKLEEVLIRTCGDLGVVTERIAGLTGVWTQNAPPGKIAAIGVHISCAVTSHGFALNVNTNLDYFKLIVPCGITDKPVTSLEHEMAQSALSRGRKLPKLEDLVQQVARNFGRVFEAQTLWLESLDALLSSSVMSGYDANPANQDTPARAPEEIRRLAGEKDTFIV